MKHVVIIFFVITVLCSFAFSQIPATGLTAATGNLPFFHTATAGFSAPSKLSYQGLLTTSVGTPVIDGNYNLRFDIYNLPASGSLEYTETQTGIPVSKGTFSVILHPTSTIFAESLFVEVTALAGPSILTPMTFSPRSELTSAPYSLGPWITDGSDIYFPGDHVSIGTKNTTESNSYLYIQKPWAFITAKATSGWAGFVADKTLSTDNNYFVLRTGGADKWALGTIGNDDFEIFNPGSFKVPLHANFSNGNVGINTSAPTATLDVNGDVRVNGNITYATAKTGYITGCAWATGRALLSTYSFTYSNGLYNNGAGTAYYEIPLQLPDGVTITEFNVYGYDADASNQFSFSGLRQNLATSGGSYITSGASGVAYASGTITATGTASEVVNNSLSAYFIEVTMPASINVRLDSYRIKYTYTSPGSASPPVANQHETIENSNVPQDSPTTGGSVIH
jgi:hypothetical protein